MTIDLAPLRRGLFKSLAQPNRLHFLLSHKDARKLRSRQAWLSRLWAEKCGYSAVRAKIISVRTAVKG